MKAKVGEMNERILHLEEQLSLFSTFLDQDQIKSLSVGKMDCWSPGSIVKSLKLRFALGVNGYNTMRGTGYPLPCYETLQSRLASYKINDGVFTALEEPIKKKVSDMKSIDRFCAMSIDGMQISVKNEYDKNEKKSIGSITLPVKKQTRKRKMEKPCKEDSDLDNHIVSVMIRGIATPWKQVIAMGVTGDSTSEETMQKLIEKCVEFVE